MVNLLLKSVVRTLFFCTSRNRVREQNIKAKAFYNRMGDTLTAETGAMQVLVPVMTGVDDAMRNWSFYQLLEHNRLVNEAITATTEQLAKGQPLSGAATIDPAIDVLPSADAGILELTRFNHSVDEHLRIVESLPKLRNTATSHHPIFGSFDAHSWNCMFAFHLRIHFKQAQTIVSRLIAG